MRFSLRLLGSFELTIDGTPASGIKSDKARALLAYLVVEADRPHRRESLAGLLWPESGETAALTSLRSALANLRKVTQDGEFGPNTIGDGSLMMTKGLYLAVVSAWLILGATPAYADKAPHQIAGFVLGENISKYESNLNRASSWPVRYQEYLTEVDLNNVEGYKNGTLTYGVCTHPGTIFRIKLKYDVSNRRFFEDLLTRYKEKFGDPDEWKGDPFQVIIAWKWSFKDARKHTINLILQHSMDDEQKLGNSVKLTDMTLLDEELLCHEKKHAPATDQKKTGKAGRKGRQETTDFRRFIPQ